jgi:hypothetical protein
MLSGSRRTMQASTMDSGVYGEKRCSRPSVGVFTRSTELPTALARIEAHG